MSADDLAKLEQLKQIIAAGKPVIFVTGHYGDWELLAQYLATQVPKINFLAKAQSNRLVDRFINRLRMRLGGAIIPSDQAPRLVPKLLKRGESLFIAGDQDAGSEGTMIDFLGRPASYFRGMALFSYHYHAPLAVVLLKRNRAGFTLFVAVLSSRV